MPVYKATPQETREWLGSGIVLPRITPTRPSTKDDVPELGCAPGQGEAIDSIFDNWTEEKQRNLLSAMLKVFLEGEAKNSMDDPTDG